MCCLFTRRRLIIIIYTRGANETITIPNKNGKHILLLLLLLLFLFGTIFLGDRIKPCRHHCYRNKRRAAATITYTRHCSAPRTHAAVQAATAAYGCARLLLRTIDCPQWRLVRICVQFCANRFFKSKVLISSDNPFRGKISCSYRYLHKQNY